MRESAVLVESLAVPIAEEKYRILLEVAEAANAHLELAAVLEATFHAVRRFVGFDMISITRLSTRC